MQNCTIYQDVFTRQDILSDQFEIEDIFQIGIRVYSTLTNQKDENSNDLEKYHELIEQFNLKKFNLDQKEFLLLIKQYLKKLKNKIAEERNEVYIQNFQQGAKIMIKYIRENFEKIEFYQDQTLSFQGQFIFKEEDYFYFMKDGMKTKTISNALLSTLQQKYSLSSIVESKFKGRCLAASTDIEPGQLIVYEKPMYFFNQKRHQDSGFQNCPVCKGCYEEELFKVLCEKSELFEHSTIHLVAEILLDYAVNQKYFVEELVQSSPYMSVILQFTHDMLWKHMKIGIKKVAGYQKFQDILFAIISNSHVGADPVGSGMYIYSSMTNHSCDNNCCFWTEDSAISIVAQRKINKGEEISISYISETYRPRDIRKQELLFRGFDCACDRCQNQIEKTSVFKQDCCKESQIIQESYKSENFVCVKCKAEFKNFGDKATKIEYDENYQQMHKFHYKNYIRLFDNMNLSKGIEQAQLTTEQILDCHNYLRGQFDPENIWVYEQLGHLYNQIGQIQQSQDNYKKALDLAVILSGENSKRSKRYKQLYEDPSKLADLYKQKEDCVIF